jgi:hypothetical protein
MRLKYNMREAGKKTKMQNEKLRRSQETRKQSSKLYGN